MMRRRSHRWAAMAAVVAGGAAAAAIWRSPSPAQPAAMAAIKESGPKGRDVPRLEGQAIAFSEEYARRIGIKLAPVRRAALTPVVRVVGTVDFNPRRVAAVGARIQGFVRRVIVLPGDTVKRGEPLAEIESAGLGQAQADLAAARAHGKAAETNARRELALLRDGLTTAREAEVASAALDSQTAFLKAAEQRVRALGGRHADERMGVYILRAPLTGTVVESHISVGQSVEADLVAFRVANLDDLWIDLAVFERTIGMVRVGDAVEITPMADVSKTIRGSVAYVSEVLDLSTRSGTVRVHVDNRLRLLRPGQSVAALIHTATPRRDSLLVPSGAITYVDGRPTVFLALAATKVVPTAVQLGLSDGSQQEIVSGLRESGTVVSDGVFALKSELFR